VAAFQLLEQVNLDTQLSEEDANQLREKQPMIEQAVQIVL
jgi:hypothetical protein